METQALLACPSCESAVAAIRYKYTWGGVESKIYRCDSCKFMFARPVPLDLLGQRQMDTVEDAELFRNPLLKKLHTKLIVGREISVVKGLLPGQNMSMLDIGCGTGWISSIWQSHGFSVLGLEPSEVRAKIARERYGLEIVDSYIENFRSAHKFDLVVMRHVVEHFADPFAVLQQALSHLREGGYVIVVVPNIDCIGRYLFDTKWTWVLPYHCNFFTPKSLRALAGRAGIEMSRMYQTPSPLWYPESFLRLIPHGESLRKRLYGKLSLLSLLPFTPVVALGYLLRLSDNITLIGRKRTVLPSPGTMQ